MVPMREQNILLAARENYIFFLSPQLLGAFSGVFRLLISDLLFVIASNDCFLLNGKMILLCSVEHNKKRKNFDSIVKQSVAINNYFMTIRYFNGKSSVNIFCWGRLLFFMFLLTSVVLFHLDTFQFVKI